VQQEPVDLAGRLQPPDLQGVAGRPELQGQEQWLPAAHRLPPALGRQLVQPVVATAVEVPGLVQAQ